MPIVVQQQMRARCGDVTRALPNGVVGSTLPDDCALRLDRAMISRAAAQIRATAELDQDLTRHIADLDQKSRTLQGIQRGAKELRLRLETIEAG